MTWRVFTTAALLSLCSCKSKGTQYHEVTCPEGTWIYVEKTSTNGEGVYCIDSQWRQGPYIVWDVNEIGEGFQRAVVEERREGVRQAIVEEGLQQIIEEDGKLFFKAVEGFYKNGELHGRQIRYWNNGRVATIEFWDEGRDILDKWSFYTEEGELQSGVDRRAEIDRGEGAK